MTRCELVKCTACKRECVRKGKENATSRSFAHLDRIIRTKPAK